MPHHDLESLQARAAADPLLSQDQVCAALQVSLSTLYRLRKDGDGPAWVRVRGAIRYRASAVRSYLEAAEIAS